MRSNAFNDSLGSGTQTDKYVEFDGVLTGGSDEIHPKKKSVVYDHAVVTVLSIKHRCLIQAF